MRVHYLQHVPFEGLSAIEPILENKGCEISATRFYDRENFAQLPKVEDFDALIVMGGPMGVNDEKDYPWLEQEKKLILSAYQEGRKLLGICLGAQLIASVLGASVKRNPQKEIGWFKVSADKALCQTPWQHVFSSSHHVLHWHGDTFDIPTGATRLLNSKGCINQAFAIDKQVIGLQFHLEMTPTAISALVEACESECVVDEFVQSAGEILAEDRYFSENEKILKALLALWLGETNKSK